MRDEMRPAFVREPLHVGGFDCVGIEIDVMAAPLGLGLCLVAFPRPLAWAEVGPSRWD